MPDKKNKIILLKNVFIIFIICIIHLIYSPLCAQRRESDIIRDSVLFVSKTDSLQNSLNIAWKPCVSAFIELLGKGFFSINIDFRIAESHAISIGIIPFEGLAPDIMYYHLSGRRHRFELGGGITTGFSNDFSLAGILIHGSVGYRTQKKRGLFFRTGFTPVYVILFDDKARSNKLYPFPGLSLGYSF
jgi:hypothetical protein